jgi:hypothetical protein
MNEVKSKIQSSVEHAELLSTIMQNSNVSLVDNSLDKDVFFFAGKVIFDEEEFLLSIKLLPDDGEIACVINSGNSIFASSFLNFLSRTFTSN